MSISSIKSNIDVMYIFQLISFLDRTVKFLSVKCKDALILLSLPLRIIIIIIIIIITIIDTDSYYIHCQ